MSVVMNWPQWVWLVLALLGIGWNMGKHGEPRTGKYDVWGAIIATGFMAWVFFKGGFFAGVTP